METWICVYSPNWDSVNGNIDMKLDGWQGEWDSKGPESG